MRKRDALRMALHLPALPKLEEWEKLLYAGLAIMISSIILGAGLAMYTRNWIWCLLAAAGFLVYTWFDKASMIIREEKRLREMARRRMIVRKLIRKELERDEMR